MAERQYVIPRGSQCRIKGENFRGLSHGCQGGLDQTYSPKGHTVNPQGFRDHLVSVEIFNKVIVAEQPKTISKRMGVAMLQ